MDVFSIQGLLVAFSNDDKTITITPKKGDPKTYNLRKNNGVTFEVQADKMHITTNKPISQVTFTTFYALRDRKLEFSFMVTPAAKVIGVTDFEGSVASSSSVSINLDVTSFQLYIKGGGLNIVGGKSKATIADGLSSQ